MAPQVSGRPRRLLLLPSAHPAMILYLLCTALILRTYPTSHIFHFNTQLLLLFFFLSLSISCFFEFAAYFHEGPLSCLCEGLIKGRRWLRHFFFPLYFLFFSCSQQTDVCSWESLITLWTFRVSCDVKWLLLNLCKQVLWIHTQSTWRRRSWAQQRGTAHSLLKTVRQFISLLFWSMCSN